MPLISVWPVSGFSSARNVGSCLRSMVSVSASFLRSSVLSGSIDIEMTVSGNSIDASRIGSRVSHSVSPVIESRRPMTPTMSPARADVELLFFFRRVDSPQLGDVFLLVASGVQHARIWLEHARVNSHPGQVARLVGLDLEYESAKRLGRIGLAANFLCFVTGRSCSRFAFAFVLLIHVDAFDRRHVRRIGQIRGHRIENRFDAGTVQRGTTQHRLNLKMQRRFANHLVNQ